MQTSQLLHLCFFLSLILSSLPFIAYSSSSSDTFPLPPVISLDGKELKLGKPYYIFSTIFPKRDGLCLVDNVKCPEDIIECPYFYDTSSYFPVTFSAANVTTEDTVVREDTPYRIEFTIPGATTCATAKYWYIKDVGDSLREFVAIGPKTAAVEFQIKKVNLGYKIMYCILLPIPPTPICYDVGFYKENGFNRLGFGVGIDAVQFFFAGNLSSISTASFLNLAIPMF
ncbi:PREDICTED: 21 kDa seed protein-like [Ipomoea nil]|uniref:21 kDa seed protein-like n=1 Tax=Ipomoea nil TaxID=35883 RepID=UPI000901C6DA|nr:PREDICTED: 21 kDa seed protein-like [Ipomoea nil]